MKTKTHRWLCRAALSIAAVTCVSALAESPKNLLFYGNSFTLGVGSTEAESFGGVPEVVKQLAIAAGYPAPRVENAAVSGQSFAWHLANNTAVISDPADFGEVPDFQWDMVVMQEYSTNPTHIGDPNGFRTDAITLLGTVRAHSPGVRGVLFETWARGPGHDYYTEPFALFPGGPAQMQQEVRDNYELARQDLVATYGPNSAIVASVGDTWESTGWDALHSTDIYHANTRGTYLTGLVIFGNVYGERTTVGLPKLFASLTDPEAAALQAYADEFLPPGVTFDNDADREVDGDDLPGFVACLNGPAAPFSSGDDCLLNDGNADDSVDVADFALMQAGLFDLPPSLSFDTWDLVYNLPEGTTADSQSNTVTATDATTPTVTLAAVDLSTLTTPTWLTLPASVGAATPFSVDANVTGLTPGSYYARVYAAAGGYDGTSFTVTLNVTATGGGQTLWFDFGDIAQQTTGNYNNITHTQDPVANAIDDTGLATGIALTVTDAFWPGSNQSGTTSPTGDGAMFDAQATRDNLFGNTVDFGGFTEPTGGFTLSGLSTDSGVTYSFTFFAARLGVADNRETQYDVVGANSATGYLNAANNQSEVAVVANVAADANGEIVVTASPGPNNNNSSGFYYIGAVKVVRNDP